jgi:hypothetical protein
MLLHYVIQVLIHTWTKFILTVPEIANLRSFNSILMQIFYYENGSSERQAPLSFEITTIYIYIELKGRKLAISSIVRIIDLHV